MDYATLVYAVVALWASAADSGAAPRAEHTGTLEGTVVNATRGEALVADAEVALRIRFANRSAVVAATATDRYGAFRFDDLPLGTGWVYLPGASRGEVHHPGPRVRLTDDRPHARVKLIVYDEVSEPNPLIVAEHNVDMRPEDGLLRVSESLVVENPSSVCYVGRDDESGDEPATLRLAIPEGVERVTFDKEFFGRRFTLDGGQLVTSIPWPPGRREIRFSYALPARDRDIPWSRRMDVPCSRLRVTVHTDDVDQVQSNLNLARRGAGKTVYNASKIPPGRLVRVDFRAVLVPFSVYGRWLSLAALLGLVAGASILLGVRKSRDSAAR